MIHDFASWLVYSVIGLSEGSRAAQALDFFVYDAIKIILLLYFMIGFIGLVRTYIPRHKIKVWLSKGRFGASYIMAALLGSITPFCSCSSIPIFISFVKAGVPLGAAFSFLVTSPLINEYLAVLMLGFFGIRITVMYVLFGLVLGVSAGMLMNRFNLGKHIVEDVISGDDNPDSDEVVFNSFKERLKYGQNEAASIVRKLWGWVIVGVGIGAFIHGFIPEELIHDLIDNAGMFSVPIAALMGIPIYANCSAVVPIAVVLFNKGVPLGTALAFMMATAALSLPEAVMLRRVMKLPLIAAFFGTVALGIVLIGYFFNMIGMFS